MEEVKSQRSDEYEMNDLWKVRRVIESEEEMMEVAAIQADAFYEQEMMEVYSNDFFFQFFKVLHIFPSPKYPFLISSSSSFFTNKNEDCGDYVG